MASDELEKITEKASKKLIPLQSSPVPEAFKAKLEQALGDKAEVAIGGSYAKGTYLPEDHDVDIFVRFPIGIDGKSMSGHLEEALSTFCTPKRVKGSRDYFQVTYEGFEFELVPVLAITTAAQAQNVTDMSILHVDYAKSQFEKNPHLPDHIRLAKQFCKAQHVYGAESYINGFSGHVVDLLVIHYGGFLPFLRAASVWGKKTFIDPTGLNGDPKALDSAKRQGPLIIIDPVQPTRNAAAAVSQSCYDTLRTAAQKFLNNPTPQYFTRVWLTKEKIRTKFPQAHIYELRPGEGSKDIAGTKALKVHEHIVKELSQNDFQVTEDEFQFDGEKALCYIVVTNEILSLTKQHVGPPLSEQEACQRFRTTHQGELVQEQDDKLIATLPRRYTKIIDLLSALLEDEYTTHRVKRAKIL